MKSWILAVALVGLFACSQAESPAKPAPAAASVKSQWLLIARTDNKGGGIFVDPALRRVDPASGLSDVTLKVVRGELSAIDAQAGAATGLYREEKVTFRFNCPSKTYALVKREALNKNGGVIDTTAPQVTNASFREIAPGGVAGVALGQACPQG